MKEGWAKYKLNELGKLNRGKSKHRPRNDISLFGGEYPFIQTGDIKAANFYISEYSQTYNEKGLAQSKLWKKETLCITIAANIAETGILNIDACFPDSVIGFVADKNKSNVKFIKYHFDLLKLHLQSISQGTTQDNLSQEKLLKFDFIVPNDVKHQQRIASILSAYDDLIEVNNKRIELLEQSARELYKEWFVRMRFPNYQNTKFNKGIPEGWEEKSPFDISEVLYGYPFNSSLFNENEGIPVVRIRDIIANSKTTFTIENIDNRYLLNDGDILIGMDGDFHIQRWMNGIAYINQRVVRLRAKTDCIYNSCFIENVIREPIFFLNSIIVGTTVAHLSDKDMKKIKLLIPTDDLIIKFKILTDPVTETIITLFKQNQQLTEIRNRLLPRLISGKLEIKE